MVINETNKQMIREIVVELFQELVSKKDWTADEVIHLDAHLDEWTSRKIDNYKVNVYGARLEERY